MVFLTGDTHANPERFERVLKKVKSQDTIIVCGDFGFIWENNEEERKLVEKLCDYKFKILFVDGTHENFGALNSFEKIDFCGGKAAKIAENVFHLLRGEVYTIENKTFFTFGGGESPDKDFKIACDRWWKEELPNIDEMKSAVKNLNRLDRKIDYIVTHEPPAQIKRSLLGTNTTISTLNRFLDDLGKEVQYKRWFFGSLHINREIAGKYEALFDAVVPCES